MSQTIVKVRLLSTDWMLSIQQEPHPPSLSLGVLETVSEVSAGAVDGRSPVGRRLWLAVNIPTHVQSTLTIDSKREISRFIEALGWVFDSISVHHASIYHGPTIGFRALRLLHSCTRSKP